MYKEIIRPFLAMSCQHCKRKDVNEEDLRYFDALMRLEEDEWFIMLSKAGKRSNSRKRSFVIFNEFSPQGGWKTKKLSHESLLAAYRRSDLNNYLLLDHNGKQMLNSGTYVKLAFQEFTKLSIGTRQLRRIVQSEAGLAWSETPTYKMVARALDHTVAVAKKYYQYNDMKVLALAWSKYYSLDIELPCLQEEKAEKEKKESRGELDVSLLIKTAESANFQCGSQVSWAKVGTVANFRNFSRETLRDTYRRVKRRRLLAVQAVSDCV
jgi:hypothetical protein